MSHGYFVYDRQHHPSYIERAARLYTSPLSAVFAYLLTCRPLKEVFQYGKRDGLETLFVVTQFTLAKNLWIVVSTII